MLLAFLLTAAGCSDDSSSNNSNVLVPENTAILCADGLDNDGNGIKDCDEDSCKNFDNCKGEVKECPTQMPEGKKNCTCDKSKGEWKDCQNIDDEEKECPTQMPEGKKNCTCDKSKGEWKDCQNIDDEEKECPAQMPEGKKNCTCDKSKGEWKDCQNIDDEEKECPTQMPEGKKNCTCDKSKGEWKDCQDDIPSETDANGNHMIDSKEPHIANAADCKYHSECTETNFCDHFIHSETNAGKCADKCTDNSDCMEGFICRPDGRCAAEAFEIVWRTFDANEKVPLRLFAKCNGTVDWGDGSAVETIANINDFNHTYTTPGDYHIKFKGNWEGFSAQPNCHDYESEQVCLEKQHLIEVVSFGPVGLGQFAFAGQTNLVALSKIDIPDSSKVYQKFDVMFGQCEKLKNGLAHWDVSQVTSFFAMLQNASSFDESLADWDTSSVGIDAGFSGFERMFENANSYTHNDFLSWNIDSIYSSHYYNYCKLISNIYTGTAVSCDDITTWQDCSTASNPEKCAEVSNTCLKGHFKAECDTDENNNHIRDSHDVIGKSCNHHSDCTNGICDLALRDPYDPNLKAGKCAKKCSAQSDCMPGFICRSDGRCAAEAFETVWRTTTANEDIYLPEMESCDGQVDWGDGSAPESYTECPDMNTFKHTYANPGDHHIKLTGKWNGWCMGTFHIGASCIKDNTAAAKLTEVVSFGPVGIRNAGFASAKNLEKLSTIDIPNASNFGYKDSGKTYASDMFYDCEKLESGVGIWDVSQVTDLSYFFANAKKFNESIRKWDVSNVENFSFMFAYAESYNNADLDRWDLSSATSMAGMYKGASSYNQQYQCRGENLPVELPSCSAIKDMYTDSSVTCNNVDDWKLCTNAPNISDFTVIKACTESDYKADCR